MILLFEGLDKSGKSTLIRNFRDLSGIPVFKNTIKPDKFSTFSHGFVNGTYYGAYELARTSGKDFIFDRSHITELAYAKVKRGYEPEHSQFWKDYLTANKHWIVVVHIDAPLDLIKKRFEDDKEEYVKAEEIELINKKYEEFYKDFDVNLIYIDGSVDRQRMLTQLVIQLQNLGFWTAVRNR